MFLRILFVTFVIIHSTWFTFTVAQQLLNNNDHGCPSLEMRRFKKSCFWLGNKFVSFLDANALCKLSGGYLAMPKDSETMQFIKDLVHGGSYHSYWVGVREVDDNKWMFSDQTPLGNYTYWAPGQPNVAGNRECVLLASQTRTKWVTEQCEWGYQFVCQLSNVCEAQDLLKFNLRIGDGIPRGLSESRLYTIGSRVAVECAPGYSSLTGPVYLFCEIGGIWTNSTYCTRGCSQPNLPEGVRLLRSEKFYVVGHHLQLECGEGKTLQGNLTCNANGNWIGQANCIEVPTTSSVVKKSADCEDLERLKKDLEVKQVPKDASIIMPCVNNMQNWPHGLWLKDQMVFDEKLMNDSNLKVLRDGSLQVLRMTSNSEGIYTCVAFGGKDIKEISIHSFRLIMPKSCNLKFTVGPMVESLGPTNFVLFRCQAEDALTSWYRDDTRIIGDKYRMVLANSALLVHRTPNTLGDYTCRAEHVKTHCRVEKTLSLKYESLNLNEFCGNSPLASAEETPPVFRGKLVGGHQAPKGSHPWIVIFVNMEDQEQFLCGGNLINSRWVASAAHCFYWVTGQKDIEKLKVKLGKYDRLKIENDERVVNIDKIIRHPGFDIELKSFDNDIALIRLSEKIKFSRSILPICLPPEGFIAEYLPTGRATRHTSGLVSGWGRLHEDGLQPQLLHQVRLPLVEYGKCKNSTRQHVSENMFCAGYEQAVSDSCQGDSGGPFEIERDGIIYLAGIVSWGEGCARPGTFGFYTKVENYLDFIEKTVKE